LSGTVQRRTGGAITPASIRKKSLDAETVTTVATSFLKRIGHKSGIKPKRVSLEGSAYIVEIEMKKLMAIVRVDAETHEIKEYEIQPKGEEPSFTSISPRLVIMISGISTVVYFLLYFLFRIFAL